VKRKVLAIILSSLGFVTHANELVFMNKEGSNSSAVAVKKALAVLLAKGLITKDISSGKYLLESTDANSVQAPNNIQTIDMDTLEMEMKSVHTTDF
jgi:hypothetical protein